MPRKHNHIHKFRRHTYKTGNQVFFCTLHDCNFKIDTALTLGKISICNRCNSEFAINEYSIRLAKPHCDKCSRKRVKDDNGQIRYVRPSDIISKDIANKTTDNLKDKLSSLLTAMADPDI